MINKTIHLDLGLNLCGEKELLALWLAETEGAKYWLSVLTELKNRGLTDIFIAAVNGVTGFPDAIETVYPDTRIQLCRPTSSTAATFRCRSGLLDPPLEDLGQLALNAIRRPVRDRSALASTRISVLLALEN